jgi:hypothetical protein
VEQKPVASANGFKFGYASLLACAWGKPSDAFGEMYRVFDGTRKVARLPGPPYHFMTRVTRVDGEIGAVKAGAVIEIEYDFPDDEWYFRRERRGYHALLRLPGSGPAALRLARQLRGQARSPPKRTCYFRNLDGTGHASRPRCPDDIRHVLAPCAPRSPTSPMSTGIVIIESFSGALLSIGRRRDATTLEDCLRVLPRSDTRS